MKRVKIEAIIRVEDIKDEEHRKRFVDQVATATAHSIKEELKKELVKDLK